MNTEKQRILIVDDEVKMTRLLKLNLEQTQDYIVCVENAAPHALATAEQFQPDLILMDVMMPGLDGGELAQQFQSKPKWAKIPIVFLTAAATRAEVASRGGRIGGAPFLAKPVDMLEVVDCLAKHLGK